MKPTTSVGQTPTKRKKTDLTWAFHIYKLKKILLTANGGVFLGIDDGMVKLSVWINVMELSSNSILKTFPKTDRIFHQKQ